LCGEATKKYVTNYKYPRPVFKNMGSVVAIMASPRREGNSSTIADAVLDGAMGLSTNAIKIHNLNKLSHVKGCQDCLACKSSGKCMTADDLSEVLDDIREADSLIISTPLYFEQASAQYRMLEDRLYSFLNADFTSNMKPGKKLVIIVTHMSEQENADAVADRIERFFVDKFKCVPSGKIVYQDKGSMHTALNDKEILNAARNIGFKLWGP
jgi:multimeric flavodoxin WrbA